MKYITSLTLAVVLSLSLSNQSQAQNCNSAASVAADIWGKAHDVAIQGGCALANAAGYVDYDACFNTATKINDLTNNLVQFWNSKVNNSWATIGPRKLDLNQWHTGNI